MLLVLLRLQYKYYTGLGNIVDYPVNIALAALHSLGLGIKDLNVLSCGLRIESFCLLKYIIVKIV